MKIDLSKELADHFERIRGIAEEAADDPEESYSSRSSAMTSMSAILRDLTKTQESVVNMERLMIIERVTIATVGKFLSEQQKEEFTEELQRMLDDHC